MRKMFALYTRMPISARVLLFARVNLTAHHVGHCSNRFLFSGATEYSVIYLLFVAVEFIRFLAIARLVKIFCWLNGFHRFG